MPANELKPGSLRYFDEESGAHIVSEPGSTSYSSTAMAATEFFNGIEWLPVDGDEEPETATCPGCGKHGESNQKDGGFYCYGSDRCCP